MAHQTESEKALEGFDLHRASTVAHFALAIGARFHEIDGPTGVHTIPLTILTSLNTTQQTTVRELVNRAREDSVMGRVVGNFIRGTLSERLGMCMFKGDEELLHAASVLVYQIDHLQYYYETENEHMFQGGNMNAKAPHESVDSTTHIQGYQLVLSNGDTSKANLIHDESPTQDEQPVDDLKFSRDDLPLPTTPMLQSNYDAWIVAENGGENLVEKLRDA